MAPTLSRIRPMTAADVPAATDTLIRGEWGDRGPFFRFAIEHPECDPLVAVDDGEIVGTGVGTANGTAGWVGVIFVTPDRRGAGIGRALTEAVCDRLEDRGCSTLVLVATDAGRRVYEKLGFAVTTRYRILEAGATAERATMEGVRSFEPDRDLAAATALDRLATGEDRAHLLAAFAGDSRGLVLPDADDGVAAFVVHPPWHGAATIARDVDAAVELLEFRRRQASPDRRIRAGLMEANTLGIETLAARGWTDAWTAVRMERGPSLAVRPDMLYGQFSFAIG